MKIVVCIKQVPDTTEIKLDPVTGTMIRDGVPSIMNPDDKGGLEMALALKNKYGAQVTVITMGPPQADDILREAFAMGADRAIHLSDRKFAGADTLATSNAIAGALRMLDFDLVITGRQAIDGDTAQVGPQIAEHLDLPQVTYVENLEFDGDKLFTIRKSTEEGYQTVQVESPCVVTVLATANKARYMSVRGIVEAYDREVEIWNFNNISVDEAKLGLNGSPTRVWKSFTKGAKAAGKVFEVEPAEAVDVIIEKLKEYGAEVVGHVVSDDNHEHITAAIQKFLDEGVDMVLCTGGMSVDPDDRTPLAIKNTGAEIVTYGAPVLPGAMFLLSYYGEKKRPVIGLPGCVMYAKRTIFDLVLPRIVAGEILKKADIDTLGEGGLCLNCPVCTFPNCGFGK